MPWWLFRLMLGVANGDLIEYEPPQNEADEAGKIVQLMFARERRRQERGWA